MDGKIKYLINYPKDAIISRRLLSSSKKDLTLFCMAKGSKISEHTSTKKLFLYVIEGKGIFYTKGRKIPMVPGTYIQLGKKIKHSLKVIENTSFMLFLSD
ncbi:MAG: cupin domain-containing protein [Candidatus Aenigmatarchaeota archaeon]